MRPERHALVLYHLERRTSRQELVARRRYAQCGPGWVRGASCSTASLTCPASSHRGPDARWQPHVADAVARNAT
jgi:hypothetical protein